MNDSSHKEYKRKPSEVRKREIIDAAINIIAFDGPRCFTAKNIAARVGMTSGGIFRHFESMEDIVGDAIKSIEDILIADFPTELDGPLKRLKDFFFNRIQTILDHPNISRLLFSDHLEQTAGVDAAKRLAKVKYRSKKFIHECILEAKQIGALDSGFDAEAATNIVIGSILSLSHNRTNVASTKKSHKSFKGVWALIERMLGTSNLADTQLGER